jgi:hypothetical protein
MTTKLPNEQKHRIDDLLQEAMACVVERRGAPRYPFVRPVAIAILGLETPLFNAFCTDISATGMRLLSNTELPDLRSTFTLTNQLGDSVSLSGTIVWKQSFSEGWFKSGVKFCK